jgi:hypothetical protein
VAFLSEIELAEKINKMGKVLSAIELAMGIEHPVLEPESGKMVFFPRTPDPTELQKLYRDPQMKMIFEEMIRMGAVNKATIDLLLHDS